MTTAEASTNKYNYLNLGAGDLEAYRLIEMFLLQVPEDQHNDVIDQIGAIGLTGKALTLLSVHYGAVFNDSHVDESPGQLLHYATRMPEMCLGELYDLYYQIELAKFEVARGRQLIGDQDSLGLKEIAHQKAYAIILARQADQ